jgi:squalene cyclase
MPCVYLQVRVYLRSIDGLPAFTEVWNSWVDHTCLPVSDSTRAVLC